MKKHIKYGALIAMLLLSGCKEKNTADKIRFAISADYPPFEYFANRKLAGLDVELAQLIAAELGKEAIFENMEFRAILTALQTGHADAAISNIAITTNRQKNFDFSSPYYTETITMIFPKNKPVTNETQLKGKKIACQLGSTMELWLKDHAKNSEIITIDNNNQSIEAIKAGHVDGALVDDAQAKVFSEKNPELSYAIIAKSDASYGIAFNKGSPMVPQVNKALKSLEKKGAIKKLIHKWLESSEWKN